MSKTIRFVNELKPSLRNVNIVSNENIVYDVGGDSNIPCFYEFTILMKCLDTEKISTCYTQYSTLMTCLRKHGFNE